jgi:hypothetical protein
MLDCDRWPKDKSAIFVSREECDRWAADRELRDLIEYMIDEAGVSPP